MEEAVALPTRTGASLVARARRAATTGVRAASGACLKRVPERTTRGAAMTGTNARDPDPDERIVSQTQRIATARLRPLEPLPNDRTADSHPRRDSGRVRNAARVELRPCHRGGEAYGPRSDGSGHDLLAGHAAYGHHARRHRLFLERVAATLLFLARGVLARGEVRGAGHRLDGNDRPRPDVRHRTGRVARRRRGPKSNSSLATCTSLRPGWESSAS